MRHPSVRVMCAPIVVLLCASACSRGPQVKARKYVVSGDAYIAKQQVNQALIEYIEEQADS